MAYSVKSTIPKFGNVKTVIDGIKFDSKREAKRYSELKMLERGKAISDLQLQVPYVLIPSQKGVERNELPVKYIADFVYKQNGQLVVEDAKGFREPLYVVKRKLMLEKYNISIKEV